MTDRKAPFIIAELSGNHNQSLDRALALVDAAAAAGADAIKLQTYTPDTMTLDLSEGEFVITDANSLWAGRTVYSLYSEAQTPWDWHAPIFAHARKKGLLAFSSPFDASAVDFLESLNTPIYKIASFECIDLPLIRKVAATKKPMVISTGMATLAEIHEAVETAREGGCQDLTLLKCTSTYPAPPDGANLATIEHMRIAFNCPVGLSDHTAGIGVAVAAVALGATMVEKHLTLDRGDGGVDSAFSLEPDEFKCLSEECRRAWAARGEVFYGPTKAESNAITRRRSLYVVKDIPANGLVTSDNVRAIRPGHGLPPKYLPTVLGMRVTQNVACGTPLCWELLKAEY